MAKRDTKFDSVKAVLIFLVVLGHVLQPRGDSLLNQVDVYVKELIFTFHMPLFVMISGYFTHTATSARRFWFGILEIFATFWVFQLIRMGMAGDFSLKAFLTPRYTLWYMMCLIYWRLFLRGLSHLIPTWGLFLISIALCLAAGYLPVKILSFQRAFAFLPFFVLGKWMSEHRLFDKVGRMNIVWALVAVIVPWMLYQIIRPLSGLNLNEALLSGKKEYLDSLGIVWRSIWLVLSVSISFGMFRLIPDRPNLARWGTATLTVYMLHPFLTRQFKYLINATGIPDDLMVNILYSVLVMAVCLLLGKSRFVHRIINPLQLRKD